MDSLFLLKKVLSALLMPLPFGFVILLLALIIFWQGYHRLAKGMGIGVLISWFLLSLNPVAQLIATPLEHTFPKYNGQSVDYVVVLGGYHNSDERFPISSLLSKTSLMRLSEGIRIYRMNQGAKLMLSGYKSHDVISNAEAMSRVAQEYGVQKEDIIIATEPKDTSEEAAHWATYLKDQRFALVTSAMHLPRSVYLFQNQGLKPIPAPTAFHTGGHHGLQWNDWLPKASALSVSKSAWHEYLGRIWASIRTTIS